MVEAAAYSGTGLAGISFFSFTPRGGRFLSIIIIPLLLSAQIWTFATRLPNSFFMIKNTLTQQTFSLTFLELPSFLPPLFQYVALSVVVFYHFSRKEEEHWQLAKGMREYRPCPIIRTILPQDVWHTAMPYLMDFSWWEMHSLPWQCISVFHCGVFFPLLLNVLPESSLLCQHFAASYIRWEHP